MHKILKVFKFALAEDTLKYKEEIYNLLKLVIVPSLSLVAKLNHEINNEVWSILCNFPTK